jgi:SAM-dependent methyltransferase
MSSQVDLFNSTYRNFKEQILAEVRRETYGEDIGQTSWVTTDEYEIFYSWLGLSGTPHILEVASGSGGPAIYLARQHGCRVTGIDINEEGLTRSRQAALDNNITDIDFQFADVNKPLSFEESTFDAVMCIDSMNHFRNRARVLGEWHRVLKEGGRILFTDPVVITGTVSNEELAARSNIGFFIFVPLDETKQSINKAGFNLLRCEDVTGNIELTSERWHDSRDRHQDALIQIEGKERFDGLQLFLATVHKLTSERRLSRFVFVAEKSAA